LRKIWLENMVIEQLGDDWHVASAVAQPFAAIPPPK